MIERLVLEHELNLSNIRDAHIYLVVTPTRDADRFGKPKDPVAHSLVTMAETLIIGRPGKILRIDTSSQRNGIGFV